jgi:hypothetical protein
MARQPRDHAAEYARRKAKAQAAGYRSLREAKQARKTLRLPRNKPLIPKAKLLGKTPQEYRENKDVRAWSLKHSRKARSKYKPGRDKEYQEKYFRAFVNRKGRDHEEIMQDLKDYLTEYEDLTDEEWEEKYART